MKNHLIIYILIAIVCSACQHATKKPASDSLDVKTNDTKLAIISINDVYRIAGIDNGKTGGLARVRALREQIEANYDHVLFLHAGDFLHPSFISKQDNGSAMIEVLNMMDGASAKFDDRMIATWGNHEFDKNRMKHVPMMNQIVAQSEFTWLDSNINWKSNTISADNMSQYKILQFGDIKVGVFSQTTDIAHPEYIESFDDFTATATHYVPKLRSLGADFVIALTHQWLPDDVSMMKLAESIRPDIIFGGHEHYVQTEQVNNRWILKADADGASAIVAEVKFENEQYHVFPQVVQLDYTFTEDTATAHLVKQLSDKNDQQYCDQLQLSSECLTRELGHTKNQLIAEETEIRRFETNLGNTLSDLALQTFASCGADVALLNSGSIRLNQNIPANSAVTVKHLEEMFPYPSDLRLIEIDQSLLPEILAHSISSWTANGHWLQVAGLVFVHDPEKQTASHIHLKGQEEDSTEPTTIRVVLPHYLIADQTDHDGYTMLNEKMQVDCAVNGSELKTLFTSMLQAQTDGLNSYRDYRICNTSRDSCQ